MARAEHPRPLHSARVRSCPHARCESRAPESTSRHSGPLASLAVYVVFLICKQGVAGSIPATSTNPWNYPKAAFCRPAIRL